MDGHHPSLRVKGLGGALARRFVRPLAPELVRWPDRTITTWEAPC